MNRDEIKAKLTEARNKIFSPKVEGTAQILEAAGMKSVPGDERACALAEYYAKELCLGSGDVRVCNTGIQVSCKSAGVLSDYLEPWEQDFVTAFDDMDFPALIDLDRFDNYDDYFNDDYLDDDDDDCDLDDDPEDDDGQ